MSNPCKTCAGRNIECTYNEVPKKRGPASGRFAKLKSRQSKTSTGESVLDPPETFDGVSLVNRNNPSSPATIHENQLNHRGSTASSHSLGMMDANPSPATEYWAPMTTSCQAPAADVDSRQSWTSNMETAESSVPSTSMATLHQNLDMRGFLIPSLPIESPTDDTYNLFAAMHEQNVPQPIATAEIWPNTISQEALLPWIDIYFKRLHPTVPVLSRTAVYQEMLLRTHHRDPHFGAMLLALCAFAMTQPVQIDEIASTPSRSAQARMLLEESIKMRMTVDFGENPSVYMILTSFFIFACLFGNDQHKAAHHRLREAVDLANSLSMHLPQAYDSLDIETREQWLRTYLVLSVTERYCELF
jgi:hypothetical protein